ncbi:MAG: c-type cytochrome [bacterium]|nr:c-type cytochrome [bacterium]
MHRPTLLAFVLFAACQQVGEDGREAVPAANPLAGGRAIYETHCAVCHGDGGAGDGAAAPFLFPNARDFSHGRFRLVTGEGGPTAEALATTLRRGIPGSSMPSWEWLGDAALADVTAYVQHLASEGFARRLLSESAERGETLPASEAREAAARVLKPGATLPAPPAGQPDEETLALGRTIYVRDCASCHGMDGAGDSKPRWNDEGKFHWVRDFTAGYLKGGASRAALSHRIRYGMPGTSMPATAVDDPRELAALVEYVRTLIPEDSDARLVQRRTRLVARKTSSENGWNWDESEEIEIALAPLWWKDNSIVRASVAALHDGESIAICVRWPDWTPDNRPFTDVLCSDAVALQFSTANAPPLFGMGASGTPTSIWHWKCLRLEELAGELDLLQPAPGVHSGGHVAGVRTDVPLYHRSEGVPPVSRGVERIRAEGVENARANERSESAAEVEPNWADGEWTVVFVRKLQAAEEDLTFVPGEPVQLAIAAWNGASGDRGATKSISIWQELVLE